MTRFRFGVLAMIALAGCSGSERPDTAPATGNAAGDMAASRAPEMAVSEGRPGVIPPQAPAPADSAAPRMLIRTGDASLEVPELEPAVTALRRLAERLGGFVANTSYRGGRDQVREASIELRIPSDRFALAEGALDSIGEVEWLNIAVQDVGEEYVDLTARLANAQRLETRLVELLATRTGKLEDVLAVERELARVREEIERSEGRRRYLRTRVAMSTLTVRVHEPAPVIGGRGGSGIIGEAFRQAWRNFVSAVAALIASTGILIPLGVVAIAVWLGVRRLRRAGARAETGDPSER